MVGTWKWAETLVFSEVEDGPIPPRERERISHHYFLCATCGRGWSSLPPAVCPWCGGQVSATFVRNLEDPTPGGKGSREVIFVT